MKRLLSTKELSKELGISGANVLNRHHQGTLGIIGTKSKVDGKMYFECSDEWLNRIGARGRERVQMIEIIEQLSTGLRRLKNFVLRNQRVENKVLRDIVTRQRQQKRHPTFTIKKQKNPKVGG